MNQFKWRVLLMVATVLLAGMYLFPSFSPTLPGWWESILPSEKIHLGLDLQGGMHLVLEVQADKAVESRIERIVQELRESLKKARIRYLEIGRTEDARITVRIPNEQDISLFKTIIDKDFPGLQILSQVTGDKWMVLSLGLTRNDIEYIKKMALDQALETIRNRLDQFGVSEPDIRPQGKNRILIQLPGIKDPQRAIKLIGKTALLEFRLVDEEHDIEDALKGNVRPGFEILYQVKQDKMTGRVIKVPFLVHKWTPLTGEYLQDANVMIDPQFNEPYVSLDFNKKGARIFAQITGENVKRRLAIVLDGRVYSAPVIQEKIAGGRARITGNFTYEEAHDLAIVLRAGALPAPVSILEERTVGPSLGYDSIRNGLLSMLVGGLLVVLFMIVYYKGSGLIADIALFLNIILIGGGLAAFRATLTLPGIAGIILTIGMAVDANVIILERIREEIRLGKTPRAAVDAGYSKATLTILDANITTLIAALVLFQFGTGPVKGFAVTLSLGILASLFTAILVTRAIFDYLLFQKRIRTLSI